MSPRPTTVIGISSNRSKTSSFKNDFKEKSIQNSKKRVNFQEKKVEEQQKQDSNLNEEKSVSVTSLASLTNENIAFIDEGRELTDRTSMLTENDELKDIKPTQEKIKDVVLADVKIHDIIKKFDEQKQEIIKPKIYPRSQVKKPPDVPVKPDGKKPIVPPRNLSNKIRGKLDKSHSTPAYDLGEENLSLDKVNVEKMTTHEVLGKLSQFF